jgi:putative DNA methylase
VQKKGWYVALRMVAPKGNRKVRFEAVESATETGLGNATCPFCGTVADSRYVKAEGCAKRIGQQMMAIVCTRPVPYADISDFFYVWLKRTVGHLYPEHFATEGTPKKSEAVADAVRYGGSREKARAAYEQMMARAFAEANRVLKPSGQLTVVYAHKTTLGWSTLVDALRHAGFTVAEAWPLDTERGVRVRAQKSAALASSIFLVARKRDDSGGTADSAVHQKTGQRPVPQSVGFYEDEVRPELEKIVRERVDSLWKIGITGADLVIAAVGAGLRAFTRFSRVEYANGEEVPAEKFLAEVEGVVLETLLEKIFGVTGSGVAAVDGPSRFYVLWRYAYKVAEMDAGEAIVFTYGQNVELDGQNGLSAGTRALVEKTALAGRKDDGPEHTVATTPAEQAALKKLVANWRALIDQRLAPREGTLFAMQRR